MFYFTVSNMIFYFFVFLCIILIKHFPEYCAVSAHKIL